MIEHGYLNIDKPVDWSSHDVVKKIRGMLRPFKFKKVGHTGTLDPFATGVLPIALGASTRLTRFLPKSKRYMAEIDFSSLTETDDITGQCIEENTEQLWTEEALSLELAKMVGKLEQLPPLYSARKQKGRRLYELMRQEEDIDVDAISTKVVDIYHANLLRFDYPIAIIDVACSEGTYIRSIARDLGGHLTKLRRLESNGFKLSDSITLEQLQSKIDEGVDLTSLIIPSHRALSLPSIDIDSKDVIFLQQGRELVLEKEQARLREMQEETFVQCQEGGELVALGVVKDKKGAVIIQPKVVF